MDDHPLLRDLTVVLAAAVAVVLALHRLKLPAIAGFLVAGALLGPSGMSLVRDHERIETLAEIGVVLLLFTVGLEFSLASLRRIARMVCVGGALQVGLTLAATYLFARWLGFEPARALFAGFLVAMSSTAIVLRGLSDRGEVDAPHGRLIVGVLLFQDRCVVPMMLAVPMLAAGDAEPAAVGTALLQALLVTAAALFAARFVVPRGFHLVTRTGRRDVFLLAVVLACAAIAWSVSLVGLPLALGAFLAGVVLADSEYGHQALADVLPLRDLLTSLFFVSVGMLLDLEVLAREPLAVAGIAGALLAGKFGLVVLAVLVMRLPLRVAVLSGLALAQVGEFGFVLAEMGGKLGLLSARESALFLDASVLTMLVTPLALRVGPHLAESARRLEALERLFGVRHQRDAQHGEKLEGHVLLLGLGIGGEMLATALRNAGLAYHVVELDPARVGAARERGEPVSYGDATSPEILVRAHVKDAAQVVVLLNDADATLRATRAARALAPEVPITARARLSADVKRLLDAGATHVVAQEVEASLEVVGSVLVRAQLESEAALRIVDDLRALRREAAAG